MPHYKIAISGASGSGKSTCFRKLINEMEKRHAPFTGFRTFFSPSGVLRLEWINRNKKGLVMAQKTGKRSMKPLLENLDTIGEMLLDMDVKSSIFVADEIGFLEQLSKTMQRGIFNAVSDTPFSIVTIKNLESPFLKRLKTIEGMMLFDLDRMDWQQKHEMLQKLSGDFCKRIYSVFLNKIT